jgi:hypothetical protein
MSTPQNFDMSSRTRVASSLSTPAARSANRSPSTSTVVQRYGTRAGLVKESHSI